MMKKVKKIPKYNTGGPVKELRSGVQIKNAGTNMKLPITLGSTPKPAASGGGSGSFGGFGNGGSSGGGSSAEGIAGGIGNAATSIASAMGIEQTGVSAAFNAAGDIASMIPGVGLPISVGLKTIGALSGGGGRVDENTGEITKSSGLTRWLGWGRSDASLAAKSSRIKSSNIAREQTQDIQADYYNNPNVEIQPNVLAAEGGVMRTPVNVLVSPGEIRIDPYTLDYEQYGYSDEKPNSKDNIETVAMGGDIIESHAKHMKMPNGKTPADNSKMILDSNIPEEMKRKMIKKITNWQEANKTKPQEYAMYGDGTGEDGVENKPIKKRRNSIWNRLQDKWNVSAVNDWLENYYNDIDKYEDHAIIDGRLFIKHDGKWYDSHKGGLGRALKGNVLPESGKGYMTDRYQTVPFKQGVFADVDKSKIVKHKKNNIAVSDIVKPNSNNGNTTNPELDFVSFRHVNSDYSVPESDIATNYINTATTESKKGTVGKPSSLQGSIVGSKIKKYPYNKNMSEFTYWDKDKNDYKKEYTDWVNRLTQKDVDDIFSGKYGDMSTYKGINKDYIPTVDEARKLMTDKKYGDWHKMSQSVMDQQKQKFDALRPELSKVGHLASPVPGIPKLKSPGVLITADRPKKQRTPINWGNIGDNLYKAASVLTPLFDSEKAESVNYQVPTAKYMSTAVDVDPQLRAINDSYAMARYNQANISPNTGAGMAYGLQAATNRAKQMSDVYKWQTNAQNELINKNVGIYNNWSNNYAGIMNDVYDKSAANRAAARNINRQNRATALKNWGQIRRDDKAYEMDRMKLQMLDPMLLYGYENYDNYLKWKKENGYG